jgi:hypothetical protein
MKVPNVRLITSAERSAQLRSAGDPVEEAGVVNIVEGIGRTRPHERGCGTLMVGWPWCLACGSDNRFAASTFV